MVPPRSSSSSRPHSEKARRRARRTGPLHFHRLKRGPGPSSRRRSRLRALRASLKASHRKIGSRLHGPRSTASRPTEKPDAVSSRSAEPTCAQGMRRDAIRAPYPLSDRVAALSKALRACLQNAGVPPLGLRIDAIHIVPRHPYRLRTLDSIHIQAWGTLPDSPIAGIYLVEPGGLVNLGARHGAVGVVGLTVDEAQHAVKEHLPNYLREASCTSQPAATSRWRNPLQASRLCIVGGALPAVRRGGLLGAYGPPRQQLRGAPAAVEPARAGGDSAFLTGNLRFFRLVVGTNQARSHHVRGKHR